MCCYADRQGMKDFLDDLGPTRIFFAWKRLTSGGDAPIGQQQYKPGTNVPLRLHQTYRSSDPTGLHVHIDGPPWIENGYVAVPVRCHRDDVIRMGHGQAVLRKLTILKANWLAAGLPKEAVTR